MALSLEAKQQTIFDIFNGNSKYIIPPYQRAYSWDEEQCSELFEDIKNSFLNENDEGYFIGNIVIAKSNEIKNSSEVIDGQQRLITLTLFIRALMALVPDNSALEDAIWLKNRNRNIKEKEERVKTIVFEDKDSKFLKEVLSLDLDLKNKCKEKGSNNFIKNICFFYKKLEKFSKENNVEDFSNYLLDNVTLLPIEANDTNQDKAREKALKIFETINNRGKPLNDSDIFKANLYAMALNTLEHKEFIERWTKLDTECDNIQLKGFDIVRVFKIYSYVVRGLQKIETSEMNLRDFFIKKEYSPLKTKNHNEVMDDLFDILEAVKFYESTIFDTNNNNQLSKWFQLIDIYTNNYPKDFLIVFLYKNQNREKNIEQYLNFSKSLVRYCYFEGSTTNIKFIIFRWTVDVMDNQWNIYYPKSYHSSTHEYLGRLYKGFGLLYSYLKDDIKAVYPYKIKRLRDVTKFKYSDYSYYDKIGHTVVTDIHGKVLEEYDFSSFDEDLYNQRINDIKNKFIEFFRNPNEN